MNKGLWQCSFCLALMSAECTRCTKCESSETIKVPLPPDAEPCTAKELEITSGLVPRNIVTTERISDIKRATNEWFEHNHKIPLSWLKEYNELVEWDHKFRNE